MKKLDKLILGSFIGPFLLTFIVVDFILLTVNMLKYFDEIFGKGLSFWIYMELIGYFVISISPMALPLAVLLSSLMTFGNLGEHFELTAIKSSGISLLRALRPIGVFVLILAFAAYLSNNYLVPKVNLKTFSLLYDIRMKSPALDIKEGVFYGGIPGYSIKVNKKVGEHGLQDILIYNHSGGIQGNLNVTMADSGSMEPFFNDNYMRLRLYNGQNYKESRATRGIKEKPVEFSRTTFDENIIIFDLDAFKLSRTAEDAWSTNRSIKNISEIKVGLDSIYTLINDQRYQTYFAAQAIYPFYTRDRKFVPLESITNRKAQDDSIRQQKAQQEKALQDSLETINGEEPFLLDTLVEDSSLVRELIAEDDSASQEGVSSTNRIADPDEVQQLQRKPTVDERLKLLSDTALQLSEDTAQATISSSSTKRNSITQAEVLRTLSEKERTRLDSVIEKRGIMRNAITVALNNARSLRNNFDIKKNQIESYEREYRRFQITWYQKYTQAFACIAMFLIGAPLGAIIKKGGLGMPVLISIIFFIVYYMLTITGEKWAKEGLVDPFIGTWFSNWCLLPFGLFFVRQARRDSRLFETDFYENIWSSIKKQIKLLKAKKV